METSTPADSLAARAVAAYLAAELERAAEQAATAAAERERTVARAQKLAANVLPSDADPEITVTPIAGRETAVVQVAGAWLAAESTPRAGLRGLVVCPACSTWNCRTTAVIDTLERLGQLIDDPGSLPVLEHEAPGNLICDGRTQRPPPRPLQQWVVRPVLHIPDIETAMNELDAAGYLPQVIYDRGGNSLVVGHARRFIEHDDDQPF